MSFGETESSMSLPSREGLSTSSQSQCSTDPGLIAGTWHRPLFLTRDRWFESGSLQQRVSCEPDFLALSTASRSRIPLRKGVHPTSFNPRSSPTHRKSAAASLHPY